MLLLIKFSCWIGLDLICFCFGILKHRMIERIQRGNRRLSKPGYNFPFSLFILFIYLFLRFGYAMLLFIEFLLLYRFRFYFGFDLFWFRVFEFSMKFSLGSNKYRIECYADITFLFFNLNLGFFGWNHMQAAQREAAYPLPHKR